jgi:hypothetical protein
LSKYSCINNRAFCHLPKIQVAGRECEIRVSEREGYIYTVHISGNVLSRAARIARKIYGASGWEKEKKTLKEKEFMEVRGIGEGGYY